MNSVKEREMVNQKNVAYSTNCKNKEGDDCYNTYKIMINDSHNRTILTEDTEKTPLGVHLNDKYDSLV